MSEKRQKTSDDSSGCLLVLILLIQFMLLCFEIKTPWGPIELDLFPPAIRQVSPPTVEIDL